MGLFDSILGDVSSLFSGTSPDTLANAGFVDQALGGSGSGVDLGGNLPVIYSAPYQLSTPPPPMFPQPTASGSVPMVARAVAAGIPRWSVIFPNLWQAIVTRFPRIAPSRALTGLLGLLRKYGPQTLAGFIGAAAVNELFSYSVSHKRRRMNVANTKALRRSVRRLRGFERLAGRVSSQLARASRGRRRVGRARCMTCHRTPCVC